MVRALCNANVAGMSEAGPPPTSGDVCSCAAIGSKADGRERGDC